MARVVSLYDLNENPAHLFGKTVHSYGFGLDARAKLLAHSSRKGVGGLQTKLFLQMQESRTRQLLA